MRSGASSAGGVAGSGTGLTQAGRGPKTGLSDAAIAATGTVASKAQSKT
ncbi:hypothetical protein GCM10011404_28700 [Sphingomonas prati]|nr:hypothetical protein GCM10011404_28700 [Sphingomonas prati]